MEFDFQIFIGVVSVGFIVAGIKLCIVTVDAMIFAFDLEKSCVMKRSWWYWFWFSFKRDFK